MTFPFTDRILLVDDERAVLDALVRQHRKHFSLVTACGPEAALQAIATQGAFAVVVTDFQMPGMDGIQLLSRVKEHAPETVRVMLTGQADLQVAIDAVNRGQIFRFLTKPCEADVLRLGLDAALEQYHLRNAEQILLEHTVRGCIEVLADVLSMTNPTAFGRATRIRRFVRHIVDALKLADAWQYETAALLSQIGWVAIPNDLIQRMAAGESLTSEQVAMMERHPSIARDLLHKIPRLYKVAEMVYHQRAELSDPDAALDPVVLGGRILGVALDFEQLLSFGASPSQALEALRSESGKYDVQIVDALSSAEPMKVELEVRVVPLEELEVGMIVEEPVRNVSDELVVGRGQPLTPGSLQRLKNYAELGLLDRPRIRVRTDRLLPEPATP